MPSSKKKKENVPVMSMAGLIRYYEEEHEKYKVDPIYVIIASIVLVAVVVAVTKIIPP
ncbi:MULTISPECIES: preprotein translocase subunit Sec61beta [Metallosphaera]|uniref:Preprotein translocase subunit SecG n=3 Tax=Metallosphaera TaxID=41980 RepID=SECG_METS5|nr:MULTISPECIES: preprotein translocase subunit Sec61beta [Metallosphaera]A4YJ27.1 RecName: Full=Preprotein translocase subunit SecG; AltName: Full=Protein transport protein Sec61 subunit beta homolog [Metallosphaera sedula DSM 5348]ABP96429.1 Sec61beta [Metallosphaera sedula DSM 5348]AIM28412.1 Sec61beta [Metallosphaera sedula]AKV75192.1 preprotein translocase subunit SecG [Metallosphaera sedula]AKV77428.1 preprotein translocase subunit SecG [Metallosphaera sedula]AKV79680.1 preprotein trans